MSTTPSMGAADPVDDVRRWARAQLVAIVVAVVLAISALTLRAPFLSIATVLRPIVLVGLIRALGAYLGESGARSTTALTAIGLTGVAVELAGFAISLWLPTPITLLLGITALVLVPAWLFGVGLRGAESGALPPPLPRRAMIGAVGQVVAGTSGFLEVPLRLVVGGIGLILAAPTLLFLMGLADLTRAGAPEGQT